MGKFNLDVNEEINLGGFVLFRVNPKTLKLYIKLHQMMPCIHINHKKWYSTYQFVVYPIFSLRLPAALACLSNDPSIPIVSTGYSS